MTDCLAFLLCLTSRISTILVDLCTFAQARLQAVISETVKRCGRSLFIFDEVEKMPPGVLDAIAPYLEHHPHINGVDYRRAIFIFLRYRFRCFNGDDILLYIIVCMV